MIFVFQAGWCLLVTISSCIQMRLLGGGLSLLLVLEAFPEHYETFWLGWWYFAPLVGDRLSFYWKSARICQVGPLHENLAECWPMGFLNLWHETKICLDLDIKFSSVGLAMSPWKIGHL